MYHVRIGWRVYVGLALAPEPNADKPKSCAMISARKMWNGSLTIIAVVSPRASINFFAFARFSSVECDRSSKINALAGIPPFDAKRQGFVLSEGSAILVLENLEHARRRGAHIYAEVLGHASSSDAYDLAALQPDGLGPSRAMRWAIQNAGVQPKDVDYINAHGTSTPLNDKTETLAIKKVFGEAAYDVVISSTKSMMGHAMGASGALEAIACTLVIQNGIIPPTINYENPDPECDLFYTPNEAIHRKVNIAMSNSFGLGGQNACLVLKGINGDK